MMKKLLFVAFFYSALLMSVVSDSKDAFAFSFYGSNPMSGGFGVPGFYPQPGLGELQAYQLQQQAIAETMMVASLHARFNRVGEQPLGMGSSVPAIGLGYFSGAEAHRQTLETLQDNAEREKRLYQIMHGNY